MSFLNNIIQRHTNSANQVQPRLKGVFEQENNSVSDLQTVIAENENAPAVPVYTSPSFSHENETNISVPSIVNSEHEVSVESVQSSAIEMMSNESQTVSPENRFSDLQSEETIKNDDSFENQPSKSNLFSAKKEFTNQFFQNENEHKILNNEKEDFKSTFANVIPVSATIVKGEDAPVSNSINFVTDFQVNQNKQSIKTLNLVKNIKSMINAEPSEEVSSQPSIIKVNIGRIDVRAIGQQLPVKTKAGPNSVMTLDEFLKQKKNTI